MLVINSLKELRNFVKYSPGAGLKYTQNFYLIKNWCYTTTYEIHLRLRSHRYRIVTLSNQSYFWNVNLPVFTGVQSVFVPVLVLFTWVHNRIDCKLISHQNKQKKSHLLTKCNKHCRTRGKFILLNLESIGKIVEIFAFKIYRIVVCL